MSLSKKTKRTLVSVFAALAAIATAVGGYAWYQIPAAEPPKPTVVVKRGNLIEMTAASGKIEPTVQVGVKSRTSGEVIDILVKEGDHVEPGQLLLRLDKTDTERSLASARVALERAKADVASSSAGLTVAQLDKENTAQSSQVATKAAELGLGSTEAARSASIAASVASANVRIKQASITSARLAQKTADIAVEDAETKLKWTDIYASIAGTVLDISIEKGSIVSSAITNVGGGDALMTIADLSNLRVIGSIDEANIGRVDVGHRVEIRVDAFPDRVFAGEVDRVSPLGKDVSNVVTFDVEIRVTDEHASMLRSGMSADVEIVTSEQKDVLLIPLTALQTKGKMRLVGLPDGTSKKIKTGSTDGTSMVVLEGVEEGETILASGGAAKAAGPTTGEKPKGGSQSLIGGGPRGGR